MNYSERYKWFASILNSYHNKNIQDVLDHPENYLGPNYKEVLNYWFYCKSLSYEQWRVRYKREKTLDFETWSEAHLTAKELAKEVIDQRIVDYFFTMELELIASHLYIERGIPFTVLPLIIDL
jgi:hypothetical protein